MDATTLASLVNAGLAHCAQVIDRDGGLLLSLFTAGLVGSVSHCAGMCGPFVLAQTTARLEAIPARRMSEWHRLSGAALLPYHAGRATTYAGLGAAAAGLGGGVSGVAGLSWISAVLLGLAALFFLAAGLRALGGQLGLGRGSSPAESLRLAPHPPAPRGRAGVGVSPLENVPETANRPGLLTRLTRPLFANPTGWRGYGLGLALGFIPCGLLYGAIAAAAATGDVLAGGLGMAAFALGTVPALFGVGLAGHFAGRAWRGAAAWAAPAILLVNALVLGVFAARSLAA